jgi:hypothetical protein
VKPNEQLRLRVRHEDALARIRQQISEGEHLHPPDDHSEDAFEVLRAEAEIWTDATQEVLRQIFESPDVPTEFLQQITSSLEAGSFPEWIRDQKHYIFRGVTRLRSLEKRLLLARKDAKVTIATKIPFPVVAVVADLLAAKYTHQRLDFLMKKAGVVSGTPPEGNKVDRARGWLELANSEEMPLNVLGKAIEEVMEVNSFGILTTESVETLRERITIALRKQGMTYRAGGTVLKLGTGAVARTLEQMAREKDLLGVQAEFERIAASLDRDPPSVVTASCALLESLFKVYIEDEALEMPSDKSIKSLWNVVRRDIKFDPAIIQDENLRKILSGLASIVDGIAALRTQKGSAHGQSQSGYKVRPRHARLAVHAASTLATFLLETWDERQG